MKFLKLYKKYILVGIITGTLSAIVVLTIYGGIRINKLDWGSVPDWIGLSLVGLTLVVTWTIFKRQTENRLTIAVGSRYKREKLNGGVTFNTDKVEIFSWVANIGNARGSFKFIGFVRHQSPKRYRKAELDDDAKKELMNEIIDPDVPLISGEDKEFFTLDSREVSKTVVFPLDAVRMQFDQGGSLAKDFSVDICWMDPVGKIYHREIIIG